MLIKFLKFIIRLARRRKRRLKEFDTGTPMHKLVNGLTAEMVRYSNASKKCSDDCPQKCMMDMASGRISELIRGYIKDLE